MGLLAYASVDPLAQQVGDHSVSPVWFGFHEVFHAFTITAWIVHYIAVALVVHRT